MTPGLAAEHMQRRELDLLLHQNQSLVPDTHAEPENEDTAELQH